jgi:hypothetical protein
MEPTQIVKNHPAEAVGPLATALAALIAGIADVDNVDTILYLAIVLSFVPAVVTWVVDTRRGSNDTTADSKHSGN